MLNPTPTHRSARDQVQFKTQGEGVIPNRHSHRILEVKSVFRTEMERVLSHVTFNTIVDIIFVHATHRFSLTHFSWTPSESRAFQTLNGRGYLYNWKRAPENTDGMKNELIPADYTSTRATPGPYFLPPFDGRAFLAFLSASILRDFLMSSLLLISRLLPAPSLNLPILFSLASATLFLRSR